MKKIAYILLAVLCLTSIKVKADEPKVSYDKKIEWWRAAKFGMFIHWGPYSLYGGVYNGFNQRFGGAEWIMNRCKISVAEYRAKASTFNPVKFNADKFVLLAKNSGMKYIVFTSKHHDGFAMFKSEASNFNIVDYTNFGRDIVSEMADACRRHDMKLGFYYSQSQDWCNAGGAAERRPMEQGWANRDSVYIDDFTAKNNGHWDSRQFSKKYEEYFYGVALPQIKELLTKYGDVAVLWWDTPRAVTKEMAQKITDELKAYPHIITNDRLQRPGFPGDYMTPENKIPERNEVVGVDWETCETMGSSWGYKSWDKNWKSSERLIRRLITVAARGGNYLLNVGPTAEGEIPSESVDRLNEMGKWMNVWGEAIYGTSRGIVYPSWGECTRKDSPKNTTLYLSVFDWPQDGQLILKLDHPVKKASMLNNGSALRIKKEKEHIVIEIPSEMPDKIASVVKVELSRKLPTEKVVSNSQKFFDIEDEK